MSNSDESENIEGEPALVQPKPHETLWFKDGSIVLATDVHLYRVHKGILARYSSVFKDMLEMPTGEGDGGANDGAGLDEWEGLLLVKMVGDSDKSVFHLLMTLYDREYYRANKPTTFPIILSLLCLSSKYDIPCIRREVINRLEGPYPSSHAEWDSDVTEFFQKGDIVPDDADFQLLDAAHQCDAKILLPALYYICARQSLDLVFEYSNKLKSEVFRRIVIGRERLSKVSYEFGAKALFPQETCQVGACSRVRAKLFIEWMAFDQFAPPVFPMTAFEEGISGIGNEELRAQICGACLKKSSLSLTEFRESFWEELPSVFDMGTWEDVKRVQI